MANNKMTQRDFFNEAIKVFKGGEATISADEMVKFFEGRIEALDKKSANKKATKTQVENEGIKATIKTAMATLGKAATVTEIQGADASLGELSNQRVSALLRQMIATDEVVKSVEGKKSLFSLV